MKNMKLQEALEIAENVKSQLLPHCYKCEIAGSIRRKKSEVKDIEIVCIPHTYEIGLFASGIAKVVNQWKKVKGELPCRYTQRILPQGIKLDLFIANPDNWGLILAIRTGSAEYSHRVLAAGWKNKGYTSKDGYLMANGKIVKVQEEKTLFHLIGIPYIDPEKRDVLVPA